MINRIDVPTNGNVALEGLPGSPVNAMRRNFAYRVCKAFDNALDNVAMNIGDAVAEGAKASLNRVFHWKRS